ncbi:ABC transporter ATP-binding protein [Anaerolentibacter hominis]|uniref:ABC transporter ATP-binding protein n=1 Tax=Anaerolentibacter hominis TaxID=3079009 RepID=UPI0031B8ABDE
MQNETVISVSHLYKSYGQKEVLHDLNLKISRGEVYGLLGANGAGKSTAIECMLGTRKADRGAALLLGESPDKRRKTIFERIGVQFQEARYPDKILVSELCEETASLYRKPLDYQPLIKQFGLEEKKKSLVAELSGGERQRLFVLLALIPGPEMVFLDELTTGLDARARRDVWNYLLELKKKGITLFLTSHYMDEVAILCDRIGILKEGVLIFEGRPQEAVSRSGCDNLEEAYLWFTEGENTIENI